MAERSEETRWFIIALIGGEAGAALGLLFLGNMLFAPLLAALAGSALGPLAVLSRDRLRQRAAERYLRTAIRGRQVTSS
jgi:hypothetical protein